MGSEDVLPTMAQPKKRDSNKPSAITVTAMRKRMDTQAEDRLPLSDRHHHVPNARTVAQTRKNTIAL